MERWLDHAISSDNVMALDAVTCSINVKLTLHYVMVAIGSNAQVDAAQAWEITIFA